MKYCFLEHFISYIIAKTSPLLLDDDVRCIGQHDSLNFKNFRSLKQQSPDFSPECYVLRGEAVHTNFKFYSLWIDTTGARIHDDLQQLRRAH